ncbi:histidine phosphatase family protein [uncultured Deinococcus sp.]|uniref:histidine phosphatase family protein n=1 Tax=uncultured Deinococcus sp. TaxID=158789 RepID=UPI0025D0F589|nr:histidine phosphatase family protein [uncultured Deinococcus sp.]
MLTLHLVRHAPTAPNARKRYPQRNEDAPLTAGGGALAAGLELPVDAVAFTSPALRTRQTAALTGFPDAVPTPALREADFGVMAGHTWAELEATYGNAPRRWIDALGTPDADAGPPGGETGRVFHARLCGWLDTLPDSGEVVAFTHAGPLLALLRVTVGVTGAEVPPGAVATLRRAGGAWWLVALRPPASATLPVT